MLISETDHPDRHGFATADVCVLGAGPAGITLALELAKTCRVVLLEAGLLTSPGDAGKDAYSGESTGRIYPLAGSRVRYFGGTSNHWGGWCRPLDTSVLANPLGDASEGWPIEEAEMRAWYGKAASYCQLSSSEFSISKEIDDRTLLTLDGFESRLFRFSPPTRFGEVYRGAIADNDRIGACLGWTARELVVSSSTGRVEAVVAVNILGAETKVEAGHFVIAMGGIENARFLLQQQRRYGGALPDNPLVGRTFMDHFGFMPGKALLSDAVKYFRYTNESGPVMPVLMRAESSQRRPPNKVSIVLAPSGEPEVLGAGYLSKLGRAGLSRSGAEFSVQFIVEPTPNDESRVTLSDVRDVFGMQRPILNWALKDGDLDLVKVLIDEFSRSLGASGSGRLLQTKRVDASTTKGLSVAFHHMGTTRMSKTEAVGVTDQHCRLWETPNLYVAGSSLFPRVGFSNPTLTIVALAARLAAHLTLTQEQVS